MGENNVEKFVIAIDGPTAAGKGVLAKEVAKRLNFTFIDTGMMYRGVAVYFVENHLTPCEENANKVINKIDIKLIIEDDVQKVLLNGEDVTSRIRVNEVSIMTSNISKFKVIRNKMLQMQRVMGESTNIVMDGRDIGTVVFPSANLKIYLTASLEERARRRQKQLKEKGEVVSYEQVLRETIKRDEQDTNREVSPLKKADDAIVIDTTNRTIEESVEQVINLVKERL